jgi:hypothetical protein
VPAPTSPEPVQGSVSAPTPRSRDWSVPPGAGKRKHCSLRVEAGRARLKHLRRVLTIVVPIYGFARTAVSSREGSLHCNGVKQKFLVTRLAVT